jgi:hypothetical protein
MTLGHLSERLNGYVQRKLARFLFKRPIYLRNDAPLISFTFDDFPRSALVNGGKILKQHGVVGTYFAALGIMGEKLPSGMIFKEDDLANMLAQGHELGCHTFDHYDSWSTQPILFEKSILANKRALQKLMPQASFGSFSYPISYPHPLTKRLVAKHFECSRCGGQRFNSRIADLNLLAAYFLEQCAGNLQAVKQIINQCCANKGWLIFATHDVTERPSHLGCTISFFEAVVGYAVNSGAEVLPMKKALEHICGNKSKSVRT